MTEKLTDRLALMVDMLTKQNERLKTDLFDLRVYSENAKRAGKIQVLEELVFTYSQGPFKEAFGKVMEKIFEKLKTLKEK